MAPQTIARSFYRSIPKRERWTLSAMASWSDYHGLQAEIRRRMSNGLYFQANYTFSKAYTDFEGSSSDFSALMDLTLGGKVEKKRQPNDITHLFKANGLWELPIGPGKKFLNHGGLPGRLLGGW